MQQQGFVWRLSGVLRGCFAAAGAAGAAGVTVDILISLRFGHTLYTRTHAHTRTHTAHTRAHTHTHTRTHTHTHTGYCGWNGCR